MSRRLLALTATAAGLLIASGAAVAGGAGAVIAFAALWLVATVAVRARIPSTARAPHGGRKQRPPSMDFPTYRDIERSLWPAAHSPRLFDHVTRPVLTRITQVLLRERAGVDLAVQPNRARSLLGPAAWRLVDPATALSEDSHSAGTGLDEIDDLLTRLEEL